MTYRALSGSQTTGDAFKVPRSGPWDVRVAGITTSGSNPNNATVTLQSNDPSRSSNWTDLDVDGEEDATWKSDGHGAVYLSTEWQYRAKTTASGPRVDVVPLYTHTGRVSPEAYGA